MRHTAKLSRRPRELSCTHICRAFPMINCFQQMGPVSSLSFSANPRTYHFIIVCHLIEWLSKLENYSRKKLYIATRHGKPAPLATNRNKAVRRQK